MRAPVAVLAALLATLSQAATERFGIFAGHNLGQGREPLRFAERDARRVAGIFRELGGMDPANVRVLAAPGRAAMDSAFRELEARARALPEGADAVFLLYFSGHGDERGLLLGREELPLDELKARFDAFPAKLRIGMFDACQSGAITRIKGGRLIEPFVHRKGMNGEGNIYITSSGGDENSQEADHLEASFFTHHLASGLRGAADASGDRKVTVMEAYNYAFNHTVAETGGTRGGTQHPNARFRMDVEGDIVLTDVGAASSGIRFDRRTAGEFLILDAHAAVMAEVNKDPRTEILVALEPGAYTVFRKSAGKVRRGEIVLKAGEARPLDEADMVPHAGAAGKAKGWTEKPSAIVADDGVEREVGEAAPRRYSAGLGLGFREGPRLSANLRANPWGYLAYHIGYTYHNSLLQTTRHDAWLGLEAFYPVLDRIHLFSQFSLGIGRLNDGFRVDEAQVEYACPDWSAPGEEARVCSYPVAAGRRVYRTHWGAGVDLGARFMVYPRFSLNLNTGMSALYDMDLDYWRIEGRRGPILQPFELGMELWF